MDRAEATGLGVAVTGHAALLAALTLGLFAASAPPPVSDAISVSFVDDIALVSASPTPVAEPPAQATAPEAGPPEEAAPSAPEPAPPQPAPRTSAPSPERARQPQPKADPTDRRRPEEARGRSQRSRAPGLGDLNLDNIGRDPSPSRAQAAPAATMSAQAAADIAQAITRQVQPCADRQVYPGPGAERIVTPVSLRLNRDGSLAGRPRVGAQRGLDDENRRYAERVADIAVAAFVGCSPLRGLPQELYDVPRGWSNFTMNYRLPG
ncbi:MAG: cell envelope biogenesis protein TolA [Sphingomonas sp.]|nr:cell envelope biogenesis protein TolA [Sphingomonas sp.]